MAGQATVTRETRSTREIHVVPDFEQLDRSEQRQVDQGLRDRAGQIRNAVDLARIPLRTLHRLMMRPDQDLNLAKINQAFMQLAEAARQGAALTK